MAGVLAAVALMEGVADCDYAYLMGVSAQAFRIQVFDGTPIGTCPSSPHAHCGINTADAMYEAFPIEMLPLPGDSEDSVAKVRTAIDAGHPAVYEHFENDLIVGYRGEALLRRSYRTGGREVEESTNAPFAYWIAAEHKVGIDKPFLIQRSIREAVANMATSRSGKYAVGESAYAEWSRRLTDSLLNGCPDEDLKGFRHANAYLFDCLWDARRQAVIYLERVKWQLPAASRSAFDAAVEHYRRLLHAMAGNEPVCERSIYGAFYGRDAWGLQEREAQAALLHRLAAQDTAAIDALSQIG